MVFTSLTHYYQFGFNHNQPFMKQKYSRGGMRLYNDRNERLYINHTERRAYYLAAMNQPPLVRTFCLTLLYTGCRLTEARNMRKCDIELDRRTITIHTLKKREPGHVRYLLIPPWFAQTLELTHFNDLSPPGPYLWSTTNRPPPRSSAYRWVKRVMTEAGISGAQACPKGLRHGLGAHCNLKGVQLPMTARWLGHSSIQTTAIYTTVMGPEERALADRLWEE